ncbi:MAG: RnfABCDGE type electron transport complex subunit D [Eubacteriales bacterium]
MNTYRFPIFPRLSAPTSVTAMTIDVIVALLPALGMAIYLFGFSVLGLALSSIGFCVFFQWLFALVTKQNRGYFDPSPWLTGLLLSFCYPPDMPLGGTMVGSFFAIVIVKELYGGLGCNFLNPALAGRLFLASSPLLMTSFSQPKPMVEANLVDAMSLATPMAALHQGILPSASIEELFIGFHGGSMGEVSSAMLLLGGCYLLLRRVISPIIPLSFLGTVALLAYFYPQGGQDSYYWMICQLFSGGLILGAFFMATDPVTSPVTFLGQGLFGVGCGILTILLRYFGSYPEGVGFAILTMNGLVWLFDKVGVPRYFAQEHFVHSKKFFAVVKRQVRAVSFVAPKSDKKLLQKLFSKEIWAERKEKIKSFSLIRPGGTALGEGFLESLPVASKAILSYALVLTVTIAAIALTQSLTSLPQHRGEEAKIQALLSSAMPRANSMSELPYEGEGAVYLAYAQEEVLGYCVEVSVSGFVDEIQLLVGVSMNGAVTGIAVLSHNETLYLGDTMLQEENLSTFIGRSGTISEKSIQGISGATITLEAVRTGVNSALKTVQNLSSLDSSGYFN